MIRILSISILFFFWETILPAQSIQGLIYGTVTLRNGAQYQGQIRLGDEEARWDHIFDARKAERPMKNLLSEMEVRQVEKREDPFRFSFMELWTDKGPGSNFSFRCFFGDIAYMELLKDNIVLLTLRNGNQIKLNKSRGGDLDKQLFIYDQELGRLDLELDENRIQSIRFEPTPATFVSITGAPVYGKVLTSNGEYEGFITWDGEECLGKDLISGMDRGVKIDIEFEDIASIRAQGDGSLVQLKSGRTIFLNDHPDVATGNHGITIHNQPFGQIDVDWKNFIAASFFDPAQPALQYNSFAQPKLLKGTVETKDGRRFQGLLVYDLDEIYDLEILNGNNNSFAYHIPFRKVAAIEPQNDKFSMVYLKDGSSFLLGGTPDVATGNHGLIIRLKGNAAEFIEWKLIKRIDFE